MLKLLTILIVLFSLFTMAIAGDLRTFEVSGDARIEQGDTLTARHIAIGYAITGALDQALNEFLPKNVIEENKSTINQSVLVDHLGYLNKLIVNEVEVKNGSLNIYTVKASITIEMDILKAKLTENDLFAFSEKLPKVIAFVQEKNIDNVHWHFQQNTFNNAELTIWKILDYKGFSKNVQAQALRDINSDTEQSFYGEDLNIIAGQAGGYGADIIIIGKSISRPVMVLETKGDSASAVAMVTLRAIRAVDGRELATSSTSASVTDTSESSAGAIAIARASEEAVINILPHIMNGWNEGLEPIVSFTMFVSGLKSLESLIEFKNDFLNSIGEIKSFERRTFSGGAAAYDVKSTMDVAALAALLESDGLKEYSVKIRSYSENSIDLSVKPK